jgi:hypothetical protein
MKIRTDMRDIGNIAIGGIAGIVVLFAMFVFVAFRMAVKVSVEVVSKKNSEISLDSNVSLC